MAVTFPLEYTTRVTSSFSWQLISTVWILGAVTAVPGALQMISAGAMSPWFSCRNIVISINDLQYIQESPLATSMQSSTSNEVYTKEYLISPTNFPYQPSPSFMFSMSFSLRCWLAPISMLSCLLPLLTLGYMYIRIFWEASKSGRDNRRRYIFTYLAEYNSLRSNLTNIQKSSK